MIAEHPVHRLAALVDEDMLCERAEKLDIPVSDLKLYDALVTEIETLKDEIRDIKSALEDQEFRYENDTQAWFRSISNQVSEATKTTFIGFIGIVGLICFLIWKLI